RTNETNFFRAIAFLFAWPGMDPKAFFTRETVGEKPAPLEWCFATGKLLFGATMVWGGVRLVSEIRPLVAGWLGLIGLVFLLHFGLFHILALAWQSASVNAAPIMHNPIRSVSLSEFWGKRWNAAFHELAHRYVYQPIRRVAGPKGAMVSVFFISGIIHDAVI